MKKTIITLAAALALGAPVAAFAQEDPNAPPVIIPDQQPAPQAEQPAEQPVKKRKKKEQAEQPQEAPPPAAEQVEQPQEATPPATEQAEQPVKKRKKKQAEQPQEAPPPAAEQAEQPQEATPPAAEQVEQPVKKRKKKEQAEQPQEPVQQPTEQQVEQPVEKPKKKEQAEQPADQTQPSTEQTTQQPQPETPATAEVPPDVTQYLSDKRPAAELSDEELAQRAKQGRDLARSKGLSDETRQELAAEAKKARAEALARKAGKTDQQQPTAEQPAGQQPSTDEAGKSDQAPVQGEGQPVQPTEQANQPVVNPDKKDVQQLDGNKASPEAETKAKAYLDETRSADQLKDDELRERLNGMRDLMAGNQLSRESERALRRKLREEREILRGRVAEKVVVEEKKDDELPNKQRRRNRDERKWDNWAARDVLRDRRRSDELEEGELRRRIDIYRDAIRDDQYDDEERAYWRDSMERDRRYLRDRMVRDRGERARYWRDRRDKNELTLDINIDLEGDREPREAVFMDEIDDEELEDYLVAAPRRKPTRRYTIEEIEEEPEVRTAMPAIEVDNIRFGFNEAFVREEEVGNLDRIAEVIEKILAAHPGEVFMIEGHTDAVGSDAYNVKLSRARAEAVKKALTTFYVVPARNLKAVGYGERYLKIPTSDAEEENRRVSLRRVTPLVGEAEAE